MTTLEVPAKLEHLTTVNNFIAEQLPANQGLQQMQVELAAEELLVNVFSYAYPHGGGRAEVGCRLVFLDDQPYFCFSVRDWGAEFNPFSEAPIPDLDLDIDERPIGGLGVHLIKTMVSHHAYSRNDGANYIELYFALSPEEHTAS